MESPREIRELLTEIFKTGIAEATRMYEPLKDQVKAVELAEYLKTQGIEPKTFRSWESNGLIAKRKAGGKPNSPWVYSRRDIQELKAKLVANRLYRDDYINNINRYNRNGEGSRCVSIEGL